MEGAPIFCTSGVRPSFANEGTIAYETDTGNAIILQGGFWRNYGTEVAIQPGTPDANQKFDIWVDTDDTTSTVLTGPAGGDLSGSYPNPVVMQASDPTGFDVPAGDLIVGTNVDTTARTIHNRRKNTASGAVYSLQQTMGAGSQPAALWRLYNDTTLLGGFSLDPFGVLNVDNGVTLTTTGTWQDATSLLVNSWVNYAAGHRTVGYRKSAIGQVFLRGLVKSGTAPSVTIFTLPSGFRPAQQEIFMQASNLGQARVDVFTTGAVQVVSYIGSGSNAFVSLAGINFDSDGS
jgi:hypothetical protein